MEVTRRDFLKLAAIAGAAGLARADEVWAALAPERLLDFEPLGNVTLLHTTDTHATLRPVYYREPDTLLGIGPERGQPPYLTGEAFLAHYAIARGSAEAYALTHVDFAELARRYGRMGGYAHLATLVKRIRAERPGRVLLMDGGDTLQGSATALWTNGADMLEALNLLGVDVMTPHWEFTLAGGVARVKELFGDKDSRGAFRGDFVAQNVMDISWGPPGEPVFRPYVVREVGGARLGVIGQAFPYTPVSHPQRYVPDLSFGIRDGEMQKHVDELRAKHKVDAVVVLSHNGVAVDLKLAARVRGIDVILGGHTHDGLPAPIRVGETLVVNSGAHGKFLSRLDLDVRDGRVRAWRYKLIPVLSQFVPADAEMSALIARLRAPYEAKLAEPLAVSESLLFRRGNFNGSFDEVILQALMAHYGAEVAFSPGFRWGITVLPGQTITLEDVYGHTALSYPNTWSREMTGAEIKAVMEDVADNLFNPDPYLRQGGDMARVGGATYTIDPTAKMGSRILDLRVGGAPVDPARRYKAAGWASMMEVDGPPVWDVVAAYLRQVKRVRVEERSRVRVKA
ncbi:MAG: thiosulfohydrolase SoxB [Burkholderiales bacterium]|nr:thiosulfohydrolase SoxB [Burkholderiales bacterium]